MLNKILSFFNIKQNKLFTKHVIGDQTFLIDNLTEDYLTSELPISSQKDLDNLFSKVERLTIKQKTFDQEEDLTLYETFNTYDINSLHELLKIKKKDTGHLMCIGEYEFNFLTNNTIIASIEYLGGYIRWQDKWCNDAELINDEKLLQWLNDRNISQPLKDHEIWNQKRIEEDNFYQEWLSYTPKTIAIYMKKQGIGQCDYNVSGITKDLEKELPNINERIVKLFILYGKSDSIWSGYPIYEEIPRDILWSYDIDTIIKAIEQTKMTNLTQIGIARFFANIDFYEKRKKDYKKIPKQIRLSILATMSENGYNSKKIRKALEF